MTACAGGAMGLTAVLSALFFPDDPGRVRLAFGIPGGVLFALSACAYVSQSRRCAEAVLQRRDGIGAVAIGWLCVALCGALPYWFSGLAIPFSSAFFESMSGFTTTGVTVLTLPREELPRAFLFWGAFSNWLGGLGVIVLIVAIFPFNGASGSGVFRAEAPDSFRERVSPRIATSAKFIWGVYLLLTAALAALLRFAGGMNWFDAVCHALSTISTGGFSTRSGGVAAFGNGAAEFIVAVFMILGAINFSFHILAMRGKFSQFRKDAELRVFLAVLLGATLFVAFLTKSAGASFFACANAITTTGFATGGGVAMPRPAIMLLFVLAIVGGCSGSTSGGLKTMRLIVLFKTVARQIRIHIRPQATIKIKIGGQALDENFVSHVCAHFIAFMFFAVFATASAYGSANDLPGAVSAAAATLTNSGFALGAPPDYAALAPRTQLVLAFCMLFGRLEFFTVMALFTRDAWRK